MSSDSETRARDPASVSSSHVERTERDDLLTKPTKNPEPNKNEDHDLERWDLLNSEKPEWLQEFRENLVDDRVPEHRDSHASSSHGSSLEPMRSVDLGKHSTYTHFPKDRGPDRKPKVMHTHNSACEDLSWNHCTSTTHTSETNGIAERAVRRVNEGTSAVLLQSGLDENWWADSMERYTYLRNIQDLLFDGKTPYERRFGKPLKGPIIPFGSLVEYYPISAKDQSRIRQFGKKVLPGNLEGWRTDRRHRGVGGDGRIWNLLWKTQCKRGDISQRNRRISFSSRRWTNQTSRRRSGTENIHVDTGKSISWRKSRRFSWRIRRVSFTTSWLISGCRCSHEWFLVHVTKLQISPSRSTKSQTLLGERRIIPFSTEIHWRLQNYSYKLGC